MTGGRFKHITDGETNMISLAISKCRNQVPFVPSDRNQDQEPGTIIVSRTMARTR